MSKPNEVKATKLLLSDRGHYIISQALAVAIETLEAVQPEVMRESSNIEDMKLLRESLFPLYVSNTVLAEAHATLIDREEDMKRTAQEIEQERSER